MVKMTRSKTFQAYLPSCHRTYSCIHCRAHLANHDELISKVRPWPHPQVLGGRLLPGERKGAFARTAGQLLWKCLVLTSTAVFAWKMGSQPKGSVCELLVLVFSNLENSCRGQVSKFGPLECLQVVCLFPWYCLLPHFQLQNWPNWWPGLGKLPSRYFLFVYMLVIIAKGWLYDRGLEAKCLEMFPLLNSEFYQATALKPLLKGRFSDASTVMQDGFPKTELLLKPSYFCQSANETLCSEKARGGW